MNYKQTDFLVIVSDSILKNVIEKEQKLRYYYLKMIFEFIKYNNLEFNSSSNDL
jgi:hypothetical protein